MQTSRNKFGCGLGVLGRQMGVADDGLMDANNIYGGNVLELGFRVEATSKWRIDKQEGKAYPPR
jgi:hypothetical protein